LIERERNLGLFKVDQNLEFEDFFLIFKRAKVTRDAGSF
jgi:hypothetical protein